MNLALLLAVSIFAGVLPMICWSVIVWWFDRYEKEPFQLLLFSFLWGMIPAVTISLLLEVLLGIPGVSNLQSAASGISFLGVGVLPPVIEEGLKFIGLLAIFSIAGQEVDDPLDGIIYGAMVGFGFAAAENTLYFLASQTVSELILLIFIRTMIFGSVHALFTAFTGLGLALAKYTRTRWKAVLWAASGVFAAIAFHFIHNLGLFWISNTPWGFYLSVLSFLIGFLFVILLFIGSLLREQKVISKYLFPYSQNGILQTDQWETAGSLRRRIQVEWAAVRVMDFKKYSILTRIHIIYAELAFKEKQRQLWGENPSRDRQISELIREMQRLLPGIRPPT
ncbi:MAG TPA: PrsW family intramembrane metalloprotease [Anaerolineales bacterium]